MRPILVIQRFDFLNRWPRELFGINRSFFRHPIGRWHHELNPADSHGRFATGIAPKILNEQVEMVLPCGRAFGLQAVQIESIHQSPRFQKGISFDGLAAVPKRLGVGHFHADSQNGRIHFRLDLDTPSLFKTLERDRSEINVDVIVGILDVRKRHLEKLRREGEAKCLLPVAGGRRYARVWPQDPAFQPGCRRKARPHRAHRKNAQSQLHTWFLLRAVNPSAA